MDEIVISDKSLLDLIENLATEDNLFPEEFLSKLIHNEDTNRHSQWSRSKQKHIRVKCARSSCFEESERE